MQRLLAIICILAGVGITAANAQAIQRSYGAGGVGISPYGSSGYGASPYGSANTYGGAQVPFGSANSPGTANFSGSPTSTTTTTDSAAPSATTNSTDYERVMNSITSATGDTDTAANTPPMASPGEVATPPNSGGYGGPLIAGSPSGAGILPGSNGAYTSPSGGPALGAYNASPYSKGEASSSANPAPGPGTPIYTGTNSQ